MARSSNGPLRRPSSALLCFSALPGVASFEEPIGRTLNIKIYHFPQILKNFLNNRKKIRFWRHFLPVFKTDGLWKTLNAQLNWFLSASLLETVREGLPQTSHPVPETSLSSEDSYLVVINDIWNNIFGDIVLQRSCCANCCFGRLTRQGQ